MSNRNVTFTLNVNMIVYKLHPTQDNHQFDQSHGESRLRQRLYTDRCELWFHSNMYNVGGVDGHDILHEEEDSERSC